MRKEALASARTYLNVIYADPDVEKALEGSDATDGYRNALRAGAQALEGHFRKSYVNPTDIASLYIAAEDTGPALDWLEKGFEVRDPTMPYISSPFFDSLRPDPRYQDLLGKMNYPSSDRK